MKKHLGRTVIGLLIVLGLLAHSTGWLRIPFIDRLEAIVYDARLRVTMPRTLGSRVAIVDINEQSLLERERGGEGRWPWPRDRIALLLDKLFDHYDVAVVGFDVVFAERDESSGIRVLERLAEEDLKNVPQYRSAVDRIKPQLDYDEIMAARLKGRPVVLGYTFLNEDAIKGQLPPPTMTLKDFRGAKPAVKHFPGYTANLPILQKSAGSAGHFNPLPDDDGLVRRVPMLIEHSGVYYEALSLAMVRLVFGGLPLKAFVGSEGLSEGYVGLEALELGSYRIPVDEDGAALVPYRGTSGSFPYFGAVDVINTRIPVEELKGKIVLIGTTAPGLLDLRATPVAPVYPGVEIHANLIDGIIEKTIPDRPAYALAVEFVGILLLGVLLALWLPILNPLRAMLVSLTVLFAAIGFNIGLFLYSHIVLPLASILVLILLLFTFNMAYGFLVEARGRRQITGLFGQYVPPELVDEMAKDPESFSMEGESREMTVLFTDVRGFTTISEGLDPKALSQLMNEFLTPLTEIIYKHRGTIDKYMGDCIMAFWGAPLSDPDHARHAVTAALEMQRALKELQPRFQARNWPEIKIGVGLNTGRMSVGNMGSRIRLAYTVMGDAVNLASRLEGITKEYGADIIVGEDTKLAVSGVVFREIDRVRVKGKDTAVAIFEPLGAEGEVPKETCDRVNMFHDALEKYRRQEWDAAEQALRALGEAAPHEKLVHVFLERIAILRDNPPGADWDGAFTFQHK